MNYNSRKPHKIFVGDFETTVTGEVDQSHTEVWVHGCAELYDDSETVIFHQSISQAFAFYEEQAKGGRIIVYFHNLKFDGAFLVDFMMRRLHYEPAIIEGEQDYNADRWVDEHKLWNGSFRVTISSMGQWYGITVRTGKGKTIEFRDSLKLLPFTLKRIGDSFKTKHRKLEMEYIGNRYPGCYISPEEYEYLKNDVLVLKEAVEIMYNDGHTKLTIGSCCLDEFKKTVGKKERYNKLFPISLLNPDYEGLPDGFKHPDEYIRGSYRGGWCYVVKGKENKIHHNGITLDVNSLYPSVMLASLGYKYPVGLPTFWQGEIPEERKKPDKYYFVRLRCRFQLRPGYLPFIQIKDDWHYKGNEMLETSDYKMAYTGVTSKRLKSAITGEVVEARPVLTLTCVDLKLFFEHYDVYDIEYLDGCYFDTFDDKAGTKGLFDAYIQKYKAIKENSTGRVREERKLFLNNLYGKMAASEDSSFKVPILPSPIEPVKYYQVEAAEKKPGYIPIGRAITSYARNVTIRAAQRNYYGPDKPGFIYADTDSIHCDLPIEKIKGCTLHNTEFGAWKHEASWQTGLFVRQKAYIEIEGDGTEPEQYIVKSRGMPERCKQLFIHNVTGKPLELKTDAERRFMQKKLTLSDFKIGLMIPSKLVPRSIIGGALLTETTFIMREAMVI